jgi:hypothetical protein
MDKLLGRTGNPEHFVFVTNYLLSYFFSQLSSISVHRGRSCNKNLPIFVKPGCFFAECYYRKADRAGDDAREWIN